MTSASITPAEELYLETIFWLEEAGLPSTAANVMRARRVSPSTVHEMIGRLEHDGYVTRGPDKVLSLTERGSAHAAAHVRRHRLVERFLSDVLGIPWDEVHESADRLAHALTPGLERRMRRAIGDATTCPHGHRIDPGMRIDGVPLADVALGARVEIVRFENEAEDVLRYVKAAGLEPGLVGTVVARGDQVVVASVDGARCAVSASVAETVAVLADPSPPPGSRCPASCCSATAATGGSPTRGQARRARTIADAACSWTRRVSPSAVHEVIDRPADGGYVTGGPRHVRAQRRGGAGAFPLGLPRCVSG
jgi:DtxR family Mn-dependent transcriptional regulator